MAAHQNVSLFTREWIEIMLSRNPLLACPVSLFTREWIEITGLSALKSDCRTFLAILNRVSLFTREWIEIRSASNVTLTAFCLPLYEGVD